MEDETRLILLQIIDTVGIAFEFTRPRLEGGDDRKAFEMEQAILQRIKNLREKILNPVS